MARIQYENDSIGGNMVAQAVDYLRKARDLLARAKAMMDSLTAGGATPANLENSPEFGVATSSGAPYYSAVNDMRANANTVSDAAIADLDQGA